MKNKKEKVYAFIDSNNLYLAIKSCGWKLDLVRFYIMQNTKVKIEIKQSCSFREIEIF